MCGIYGGHFEMSSYVGLRNPTTISPPMFDSPSTCDFRWRQAETQRAVAEAELDLCSSTANDKLERDFTEAVATEHTAEGSEAVSDKGAAGHASDDELVVDGGIIGEAEGSALPDETGDDRGTALEPGEVR